MAALRLKEETASRLVFGTNWMQRISSLVSLIVMAGVAYSLLSSFGETDLADSPLLGVIIVVIAAFVLSWLYSAIAATQVVIDMSSRIATRTTSLVGIPIRRVQLPLDNVRRVLLILGSPVSRRQRAAGGWQLALESVDGPPLVVNYDGSRAEMTAAAQKVSALIRKPLVDTTQSGERVGAGAPGLGPIRDFGGGRTSYAPPVAAPFPIGGGPGSSTLTRQETTPPAPPPTPAPTSQMQLEQNAERDYASAGEGENQAPLEAQTSQPETGTPMQSGTTPFDSGPTFTPLPPLEMLNQPPIGTLSTPATPIPEVSEAEETVEEQSPARQRTIEELTKAVGDDPTDGQAFYQLGRAYHARGILNKAQEMYQNATRLDPLDAAAQNDLGALYLQTGNFKDAETWLRRAGATDPFSPMAHYNLGLLLMRTGRGSEALKEFSRAAADAQGQSDAEVYSEAAKGRPGAPILSRGA